MVVVFSMHFNSNKINCNINEWRIESNSLQSSFVAMKRMLTYKRGKKWFVDEYILNRVSNRHSELNSDIC